MVNSGYKQTEVGKIPEDWDLMKISEIATVIRGASPRPKSDPRFYGGPVPRLMVEDVTRDKKRVTPCIDSLTNEGAKLSRFCKSGTLTVVCSGTPSVVGLPSILAVDACIHDGMLALANLREKADSDFLFHELRSIQEKLYSAATHGGTFVNLTTAGLKAFQIVLPTRSGEQQRIASALTDVDEFIDSLENLIAKKRLIKHGVTQDLLIPQKGWEERTLFELASNKKEFFDDGDWIEAVHITDSGVRLVQTGNIGVGQFVEKDEKKYVFEKSFESLHCKPLRRGDLLICRLAEPAGRACIFPDISEDKTITSVDVTIFRPPEGSVNRTYLVNLFSTKKWFAEVADKCGGTTHKRISKTALGQIKIMLPSVAEQDRVAKVLSDIDTDLSALQQKLAKARQIKQGMMQELLTGRIRLI